MFQYKYAIFREKKVLILKPLANDKLLFTGFFGL